MKIIIYDLIFLIGITSLIITLPIIYYQETIKELTSIHNSNDNALNWESVSRMELAAKLLEPVECVYTRCADEFDMEYVCFLEDNVNECLVNLLKNK